MEIDETRLRVIHTLRLRSLIEAAELARLSGIALDRVQGVLETEAANGLVIHRSGVLTGWALTSTGRVEGERLLAQQLDRSGQRPKVEAVYRDFLDLNPVLLGICSDWQTVTIDGIEVVNDHLDVDRDQAVLDRLSELHLRSLEMAGKLADVADRFGAYGPRLSAAHERIQCGNTEWLTRSTIDSYHTVWFELHEDLLATLGKRRIDERPR